ncbi:serine/threonine-protein kinase [Nocardia spumae]|uniref:serine/threonine-protein kinase n=1 Tax=Nocardia spumae TaxID=2887190 RepID=UPI001D150BE0|nr:serine/threonine-protein kinase [Nocardia spumae]
MAAPGIDETFAGYLIEGMLGRGGMGTVYLARHPRLPRRVALKVLDREVSADSERRRRFDQEADIVARLEHPGIVRVYDRGADAGHLWISMQYVHGTDTSRLDRQSLTVERVLRIIAETGAALDYAHSKGVLHRDIKPANILVEAPEAGRAERAVLTDFGIARLQDTDTELTVTGTLTATLAYASPEQLSGEPLDHRCDQYSLACTLFTLLSGRPPYAGTNPGQVVAGHVTKPIPRLTAVRTDLPPALDVVLARAMAKQPADRYDSCGEFVEETRKALRGGSDAAYRAPVSDPPDPRSARHPAQPGQSQPSVFAQPAPERQSSTAAPAPVPKRRRPWLPVAVAVVVAAALVGAGVVVVRGMSGSSGTDTGWGAKYRLIADSFPGLVADRPDGTGGLGTRCSIAANSSAHPAVTCVDPDRDLRVDITDLENADAAAEFADAATAHSGDLLASHPGFRDPVDVVLPTPDSTGPQVLYTLFPQDAARSRFAVGLSWTKHAALETYDRWWPQVPMGAADPAAKPNPEVPGTNPWCYRVRTADSVNDSGPGGSDSGPAAVLAYEYAQYVSRSGSDARQYTAAESTAIPSAQALQTAIDQVPVGTQHCVHVTGGTIPDRYEVQVFERRPDRGFLRHAYTAITTTRDGRVVLKEIRG